MDFSFICEGDTTSHGGRVLACAPENEVDGRPLALLGDKVSCPKCGGIYPIVGVKDLGVTFDGRPVASEGDTTACGAALIASQNSAIAEPTSGAGALVGSGMSVFSQLGADKSQCGRFQLVDDATRQPIAGHPYTVTSADGRVIHGKTDATGFTDWLEGDVASSLTLDYSGSESAA
jgi:uncharacterized Zn-binding protein involved in type VI secretion